MFAYLYRVFLIIVQKTTKKKFMLAQSKNNKKVTVVKICCLFTRENIKNITSLESKAEARQHKFKN